MGEKEVSAADGKERDSGLLIHCNGRHGAFWNVWMQCLECQIQEADTGDFYALAGTSAMVPVAASTGKSQSYQPDGEFARSVPAVLPDAAVASITSSPVSGTGWKS